MNAKMTNYYLAILFFTIYVVSVLLFVEDDEPTELNIYIRLDVLLCPA